MPSMEEIMSGSESKQLIGRYLQALSGQDKPANERLSRRRS